MDEMESRKQISIARDTDITGLKELADVIHKNGSRVIAQIGHAGSKAGPNATGCMTISASAVPI